MHLSPLSGCTLNKIRPYEELTLTNHHNKIYYVRQIVPICVWRVCLVPCYSSSNRINSFRSQWRWRQRRRHRRQRQEQQYRHHYSTHAPSQTRTLCWSFPGASNSCTCTNWFALYGGGMVLVGRFSKRIQFPLLPPPPSDGEMMTPVFLLCAVVVVVFVLLLCCRVW